VNTAVSIAIWDDVGRTGCFAAEQILGTFMSGSATAFAMLTHSLC
jgi:hypothetical protein